MGNAHTAIAALALAFALALTLAAAPTARGADRTFMLFGSDADGWGSTNTTLANPGPTITVDLGDNVTLVLNSTDGPNHNWFIDYDNDGGDDPTEPNSPNFQDQEIEWNFTADTPGTFTYRCKFHATTMTGTIVVRNETTPPGDGGSNTALVLGVALLLIVFLVAVGYFFFIHKKK